MGNSVDKELEKANDENSYKLNENDLENIGGGLYVYRPTYSFKEAMESAGLYVSGSRVYRDKFYNDEADPSMVVAACKAYRAAKEANNNGEK